jgi:hypothetical protein
MVYNSNATGQDIVSLADSYCKSNSVSFPIKEKTLYANEGNRIILSEIFNAYGGMKYDDRNNTNLPISTTNIVSGQDDYALPLDLSWIEKVYVQDENSDIWRELEPISLENIKDEPDFMDVDSVPMFYRVIGNSIKIYPATNFSKDDALMIEYARDISTFATTDTIKTPGFDQQYHGAIAIYMSYQYELANHITSPTGKIPHEDAWLDILARIKRHYTQKFKQLYPTRIKITNTINEYI